MYPSSPEGPPKLLLDANIFRRLGEGALEHYEERLLQIAKWRTPPLFWVCPITLEELFGNLRPGKPNEFARIREALVWTERLCGVEGTAEHLEWVLKRGMFVAARPYDGALSSAFDSNRRLVSNAARFEDLQPTVVARIARMCATHAEDTDRWLPSRVELIERAKRPPDPDDPDSATLVETSWVAVSRKRHEPDCALWGEFKSVRDQLHDQRELIAFDIWHIDQAARYQNYNIVKRQNDYNDGWLCAYPAVGYTLVTRDGGIINAVGRCESPRIKTLDEAINCAEAWLEHAVLEQEF